MNKSDPEVKEAIRETLEKQLEDYELPAVFWSLDAVYDEYDERMQKHQLIEVPIFEAEVVVPDHNATSGERYETITVDGVADRNEAEERLERDPEVREIVGMEQVDTAEVFM